VDFVGRIKTIEEFHSHIILGKVTLMVYVKSCLVSYQNSKSSWEILGERLYILDTLCF
jgi:hypothetical protein